MVKQLQGEIKSALKPILKVTDLDAPYTESRMKLKAKKQNKTWHNKINGLHFHEQNRNFKRQCWRYGKNPICACATCLTELHSKDSKRWATKKQYADDSQKFMKNRLISVDEEIIFLESHELLFSIAVWMTKIHINYHLCNRCWSSSYSYARYLVQFKQTWNYHC